MSKTSEIRPLSTSEKVEKERAAQQVAQNHQAQMVNPAQHVAPGAHASPLRKPEEVAATDEELGREAVERIEGTSALHPPSVPGSVHRTIALEASMMAHVHASTWPVLRRLSRAHGHEIHTILQEHPEVAQELAAIFIHAGGIAALDSLHPGHSSAEMTQREYAQAGAGPGAALEQPNPPRQHDAPVSRPAVPSQASAQSPVDREK